MPELDLHGRTSDEALRVFVQVYNQHVRRGSRESLRVIHGYGSTGEGGKIRRKIRAFLETADANLEWKCGEDVEGNPGLTIVYPGQALPSLENELASKMLHFCSIPRTESKIAAEFRKYSPREIKLVIRTLVRQGRIQEVLKGGRQTYVTATSS